MNIDTILHSAEYKAPDGSIRKLEPDKIKILKDTNFLGRDQQSTYEILALLYKVGFDHVMNLIRGNNAFSEMKEKKSIEYGIIFGNELMKESQERKIEDLEIFRKGDIMVEGAFDCPVCKSRNTSTIQRQVRSADEPMTSFNTCKACTNKWRIG
jgi:DNA-directed RNA polymerase subunit M/transcription elongation factor TFIIS